MVVTSAGLTITVDLNGDFLVLDAASGKLLHKIPTGQQTGGGVITYEASGKQRVAIAGGLEDRNLQTHGKPIVMVYGL